MKVTLATQEPEKVIRLQMIKDSLSKKFDVRILEPILKIRSLGRMPSAILRYGGYMIEEALIETDILHAFSSPDFIHIPALFRSVRLCYDYRSNYSEKLSCRYPTLGFLAMLLEKNFMKKADILLTVNSILKKRLEKTSGKSVYLVPNYPSRNFKAKSRVEDVRERYHSKGSIALFVGSLTDTYDFQLIARVAKLLPKVIFWIVGSGPLQTYLEVLMPKNVLLLGRVVHDQIPDLINAADVCLAPIKRYTPHIVSNDQDVWKISEYAALRKPIVGSGLAPSSQYVLAEDAEEFAKLVDSALKGNIPAAEPHFWEDESEPQLFEAYSNLG